MKKLTAFLILLPTVLNAQRRSLDIKSFQKEFDIIQHAEMQAFDRAQETGSAGNFTVASSNFDIHYLRADWSVDPSINYISGNITFYFTITQPTQTITLDLKQPMIADSVLYHGNALVIGQTPANGLDINFPALLPAGTFDSISIYYQGAPDPTASLGSFRQTTHDAGIPVIWTLSEPYGARDWWPCKNGLDDKIDSVDIFISCPQQYQPSSNGVIVSNAVNGPTRTTHFRHRYPVATYLLALAVSDYVIKADTVQVPSGVQQYLSFAYSGSAVGFFGDQFWSKTAYRVYSNLFGPYPFAAEKYGHTQFGASGGMEHQTNSFVNYTSPNLSAHELAHQWFGDYITCGSWQHIWLNEGFATYCTLLFIEYGYPDFYSPTLSSIYSSAIGATSGSVFVPDTGTVGRIFSTRLSYNKGAYVLHMLRWVLGDSAFFRGVRRYLADPALRFGYARTADLQRNLQQESGKNLSGFFQRWVYGEGYPNYQANWQQNTNNWVTITLNQTTTHASVSFYDMPVEVLLRGASEGKSFVLDHTYNGQSFTVNPGFVVDTILIDPYYHILSATKTSTKVSASNVVNEIEIYPNPVPSEFFVVLKNPSDKTLSIQLFDAAGKLVYKSQLNTPGNDERIRVPAASLARGIYFLHLNSEKNIHLVKKIAR